MSPLVAYLAVTFSIAGGVLVVAVLIIWSLPANYFVRKPGPPPRSISPLGFLFFLVRNALGILLIIAGLILVLPVFPLPPGTGFVIAAVGLIPTDLPGKRPLLRWLIHFRGVAGTLNWVRRRLGRQPFVLPVGGPVEPAGVS